MKKQQIKGSFLFGSPFYKQMGVFHGIFDGFLVDYTKIGR